MDDLVAMVMDDYLKGCIVLALDKTKILHVDECGCEIERTLE